MSRQLWSSQSLEADGVLSFVDIFTDGLVTTYRQHFVPTFEHRAQILLMIDELQGT